MKSNKLNLAMTVLKFGLGILGVILCILVIGGPNADGTELSEQIAFREGGSLGAAVGYTGILLFAGIGIALLFFIFQFISNPKKTFFSIVGIIAALILFILFYFIGSGDTNESLKLAEDVQVDNSTIGSTTAGLWTAIIAVGIGALLFVYDLVKSVFKL